MVFLSLEIKDQNQTQKMELISGGRSTLNPNAPIYIPAAFRQVEDFSPEWWQLVTTLTWYHDYWLSQQQDEEGYYSNAKDEFDCSDVLDLLPDTFDLDADEDLSLMEAQLEEFIQFSEAEAETGSNTYVKPEHGAKPPTT